MTTQKEQKPVAILALAGDRQAGKSTIATYLQDEYEFVELAFADSLKRIAAEVFGNPVINYYDNELKEAIDPSWGMTHRQQCLKLSDALKPVLGDDVFIRRWARAFAKYQNQCVIVPDLRTEEERAYLTLLGATIVHVVRPGHVGGNRADDQHPMHQPLKVCQGDIVLVNDKDIAHLQGLADTAMLAALGGLC